MDKCSNVVMDNFCSFKQMRNVTPNRESVEGRPIVGWPVLNYLGTAMSKASVHISLNNRIIARRVVVK